MSVNPSVRRVMRLLGAACLFMSLFCFTAPAIAATYAPLDVVRLFRSIFGVANVAAVPAPAPSGSPRPRRPFLGEGAIDVSGSGAGNIGYHRSVSPTGATSLRGFDADMTLAIARRTEQTSLSITQAIAQDTAATSLSQLAVQYRTPIFGLLYGPLASPADTQLGIGGFARGLSLSIPRGTGEISLFVATALGTDQQTFRVLGGRRSYQLRPGRFLALTLLDARSEGATDADSRIAALALDDYGAARTVRLEAALNGTHGLDGVADGARAAYAASVYFHSLRGYSSFGFDSIPYGFSPVGLIQQADREATASFGRTFGSVQAQVDGLRGITTDATGTATNDTRGDASLSAPVRFLGELTASGSLGHVESAGGATLSSSLGVNANQNVKGFQFSEGYLRSTVGGGISDSSYTAYTAGASHLLFGGFLAGQTNYQVSTSDGRSTSLGFNVNFSRPVGRRDELGVQLESDRVVTNGIGTAVRTLGATLTHRISSSLSLQVAAARTYQSGLGGGAGSSLDVSLLGPVAFGSATRYAGRANPKLPAIVQGRIIFQSGITVGTTGPFSSRGLPGVVVVLDGLQTQRTDSDGGYEFRFVKPGDHTVAVQDGTIPLGLVADRDARQFTITGGQVFVADFTVGSFGGVRGRVTSGSGPDALPLPGVSLMIDGAQRVITAPDGTYQLGRLGTGAHSVQILGDTLPASAQLAGTATRQVQVVQGQLASADFTAVRLGAITGTVFAGDPAQHIGAPDVYVVAQPGDHAAITGADGAFYIDNLTPGAYKLGVDPQTLPDGTEVAQGDGQSREVSSGQTVSDIVFALGEAKKDVEFNFTDRKRVGMELTLDPLRAPPDAVVDVRVTSSAPRSTRLEGSAFGRPFVLKPVTNGVWTGRFIVPVAAAAGDSPVHVETSGSQHGATDALFTLDPKVPLITVRYSGRRAIAGQTVHVIAKILADVHSGDAIDFGEGQVVRLPEPHGRVFGFNVRIGSSGLPMRGTLTTTTGERFAFVIDRSHGSP